MFRDWGFLITEIMLLLVLAALLGVLVGWIIWGRRKPDHGRAPLFSAADLDNCQSQLRACRAALTDAETRGADLAAQVKSCAADRDRLAATLDDARQARDAAMEETRRARAEAESALARAAAAQMPDYDRDGVREGVDEGTKPTRLDAPRDGTPDDLKRIKGIGPKLEQLCFDLGFFHFDQIAAWTEDEIAWVNANLTGFTGRVSRDNWVEQAKLLAEGGETEFSQRVDKGEVY